MSYEPPSDTPGPDARRIADAIERGWIGRGFKLGLGFFLAGVVIWLIPIFLLASCVGGLAALGGAAAFHDAEVEVTTSTEPPAGKNT